MNLNAQQLAAIKIIDRPLLVIAGAGSGKTRVITEKIAYLVKQGLPAKNIAAVTFTNKAAREMKTRVNKLLDSTQSRGLRVSTFHALGFEILKQEHNALNYKSSITLFDEQDKIALIKELLKQANKDISKNLLQDYSDEIGRFKNTLTLPEKTTHRLYQNYVRCLQTYNAVDLDDLILLPVQLFKKNPDILEKWQNKIRYLLVDEYQDTNLTQYELVKLLTGNLGKFTVVGDDDQSIYAWRGAQTENLLQLQKDFPRLEVIKLEQNYRSTGRILKVANHLIANNPHIFEKKLWSTLDYGEPLKVLHHANEQDEAKKIVSELIYQKFCSNNHYQDYAILYRSNHQANLIEQELRANHVPYFISGGTSFFSRSEIKDILCYLRILANPNDDAAFLRIANVPHRELGANTLEKLNHYARERQINLLSACNEIGLSHILSNRAYQHCQGFYCLVHEFVTAIKHQNLFLVIENLIKKIDYEGYLLRESSTKEVAKRKMRNVSDLIDWFKRIAEREPQYNLSDMLSSIMLSDMLSRNQEKETQDCISLMTLHAAKGLEFPHVFLIGMEEDILPHQNSSKDHEIQEERRLAYVGITRAQFNCTLSYCRKRRQFDKSENKYTDRIVEPSRFLNELPQDDLTWGKNKKLSKAETKSRFSALTENF